MSRLSLDRITAGRLLPFWVLAIIASAVAASKPERSPELFATWNNFNRLGRMDIFAADAISTFAGAKDSDFAAMRRSYEESFGKAGQVRPWQPASLEIKVSGDLAYGLADWQLIETQPNRKEARSRLSSVRAGLANRWKPTRMPVLRDFS